MRSRDCEAGAGRGLSQENRNEICGRKAGLKARLLSQSGGGKSRTPHTSGGDCQGHCVLMGAFDHLLCFLSHAKLTLGRQKAACECSMSCTAHAMTSASRGPHPPGDVVEQDILEFDFDLPLANCGNVI